MLAATLSFRRNDHWQPRAQHRGQRECTGSRVELFKELTAEQRPMPFTEAEQIFRTFNSAWAWLGATNAIEALQNRYPVQ